MTSIQVFQIYCAKQVFTEKADQADHSILCIAHVEGLLGTNYTGEQCPENRYRYNMAIMGGGKFKN